MKTFSEWLESYKDVDPEQESKKIQDINMTASLPLFKTAPLNHIKNLTRGFHLNTIIGRMMQRWTAALSMAPREWRISKEKKAANDKYKAAYDLFKQEIANAVDNLPYKTGVDIRSGKPEDILAKSKEFFKDYVPENKNLIQSMNNAWKIYTSVFGDDYQDSQIQNFLNFYQIVKEEFLTIGEMLPTLGEPTLRHIESKFANDIQKEIDKYDKMLRGGR